MSLLSGRWVFLLQMRILLFPLLAYNEFIHPEAYSPSTNTWTTLAPMSTSRYGLAAALGSDGRVYAIGGYHSGVLNTVEAYSP